MVVVAHCVVIFWPRKPISGPTDKTGMPIVWHNQDTERKDVACVWGETAGDRTPAPAVSEAAPVTSFSHTVQPLGQTPKDNERSVA